MVNESVVESFINSLKQYIREIGEATDKVSEALKEYYTLAHSRYIAMKNVRGDNGKIKRLEELISVLATEKVKAEWVRGMLLTRPYSASEAGRLIVDNLLIASGQVGLYDGPGDKGTSCVLNSFVLNDVEKEFRR